MTEVDPDDPDEQLVQMMYEPCIVCASNAEYRASRSFQLEHDSCTYLIESGDFLCEKHHKQQPAFEPDYDRIDEMEL